MSTIKPLFFIFILLSYLPSLLADQHLSTINSTDEYNIVAIDYQNLAIAVNVRDTWKLNNISSYTYTVINKCFCDIAKRAQVFVYNNRIVKVLDLDKGNLPLDEIEFEKYKTIDEYVTFINDTLKKPLDKAYIDHDRHLGFPSKIFIDPNKRLADDETNININNLNLLVKEQYDN